LAYGPWLTPRSAAGDRPLDIALRNGHARLVDAERLRLPELDVLTELEKPGMWVSVPGMYGGFRYVLEGSALKVDSWIRVTGGVLAGRHRGCRTLLNLEVDDSLRAATRGRSNASEFVAPSDRQRGGV
jgi:hypothetical protein